MQDALHCVVEDGEVWDAFLHRSYVSHGFPKKIYSKVPSGVRSGSQNDTEVTDKLFALVSIPYCVF